MVSAARRYRVRKHPHLDGYQVVDGNRVLAYRRTHRAAEVLARRLNTGDAKLRPPR
jgi:hypothetical protein